MASCKFVGKIAADNAGLTVVVVHLCEIIDSFSDCDCVLKGKYELQKGRRVDLDVCASLSAAHQQAWRLKPIETKDQLSPGRTRKFRLE